MALDPNIDPLFRRALEACEEARRLCKIAWECAAWARAADDARRRDREIPLREILPKEE